MPNIPSMEPQILIDLLALSLEEAELAPASDERLIAVLSPWFSNVELTLSPSGCHSALSLGRHALSMRFAECLKRFRDRGWIVS